MARYFHLSGVQPILNGNGDTLSGTIFSRIHEEFTRPYPRDRRGFDGFLFVSVPFMPPYSGTACIVFILFFLYRHRMPASVLRTVWTLLATICCRKMTRSCCADVCSCLSFFNLTSTTFFVQSNTSTFLLIWVSIVYLPQGLCLFR